MFRSQTRYMLMVKRCIRRSVWSASLSPTPTGKAFQTPAATSLSRINHDIGPRPDELELKPRYNIAPTQMVPIVRLDQDAPASWPCCAGA